MAAEDSIENAGPLVSNNRAITEHFDPSAYPSSGFIADIAPALGPQQPAAQAFPNPAPQPPLNQSVAPNIQEIMNEGFSESEAKWALEKKGNDIQTALDLLRMRD